MSAARELLLRANDIIVRPVLALLFAVAMLVFFWGLADFIRNAGDVEGRARGKRNILWGLVGMTIMLSSLGIVSIIANTLEPAEQQLQPEGRVRDTPIPLP